MAVIRPAKYWYMNEQEIKLEITEKKITGFYNEDGYCITVNVVDLPLKLKSTFFLSTNEKNFTYYKFLKLTCEQLELKAREQMKHKAGDMKEAFSFENGEMRYYIWNGAEWIDTGFPARK